MYPLSLQELRSDNTAYTFRSIYNLIIFNLLWSIVKRSKELSKLQCFWDFYILSHKFKEKTIFFSRTPLLRTPAITRVSPIITRRELLYSPRDLLSNLTGRLVTKNILVCATPLVVMERRFENRSSQLLFTRSLSAQATKLVHFNLGVLLRKRIAKSRTHFLSNG